MNGQPAHGRAGGGGIRGRIQARTWRVSLRGAGAQESRFALRLYRAGVIFSKLQPGLATLFVDDTGAVQMKTWAPADDAALRTSKYARQNGVPLIEYDEKTATSMPGPLVNSWGPGTGRVQRRTLAHAAFRRVSIGFRSAAISGLWLLFDRDTECDGTRFPSLWLPICHAPRYECVGAYVFRRLLAQGRQNRRAAFDRRHGRSRPQGAANWRLDS